MKARAEVAHKFSSPYGSNCISCCCWCCYRRRLRRRCCYCSHCFCCSQIITIISNIVIRASNQLSNKVILLLLLLVTVVYLPSYNCYFPSMFPSLSLYPNLLSLFHWFSHKILRRLFSETYSLSFLYVSSPHHASLLFAELMISDFFCLFCVPRHSCKH